MSNVLHARTKMFIYNELKNCPGIDIKLLLRNLAVTEHLRWNAAHEMMGYKGDKKASSCDDLKKTHNCLVPWEDLDEVSRRSVSSYNAFYPFSKKLIIKHPELKRYLSQDIHVHVEYRPVYKKYDEVVVETTLKMWEDGELRS